MSRDRDRNFLMLSMKLSVIKKIIAEDLGVSLPEVDVILRENNYPSMKVLEFAFGGDRKIRIFHIITVITA